MPAPDQHFQLVAQIERLPTQVANLVADLTPDQLTGHFLAGEWSVAQNVHHLADSHMNAYIRCRLILTEESPPLKPYDQERWADLPDAAAADVAPSLALLTGLHGRWTAFWSSLAPDDWARDGIHPENGVMTLADILQSYAAHGGAHLDQMSRTLLAQYAQLPASKEELLGCIDREWRALQSFVGRHSTRLEAPDVGGWSIKDNLAHLAAWERYLARRVLQGHSAASAFGLDEGAVENLELDALNAIILQRSRERTLEEVLEESEQIHLEAVEHVKAMPWAALLATPAWRPAGDPILGSVAGNTYEHYLEHGIWLRIQTAHA